MRTYEISFCFERPYNKPTNKNHTDKIAINKSNVYTFGSKQVFCAVGICWVLWLCFIFFYHKSPVLTYFLSQKDQSNTHQHAAVRYQWCKGCVRFVFAIADKIMKTLYITMLIMEIYSSLSRKNVKSKDSRYHHQNITVDLKKAMQQFYSCNCLYT